MSKINGTQFERVVLGAFEGKEPANNVVLFNSVRGDLHRTVEQPESDFAVFAR